MIHNINDINNIISDINQTIELLLPQTCESGAHILLDAMKYSMLSNGKRIRGLLVVKTGDMFAVDRAHSLKIAAIIEMIHTYSLIHDDLPAMDDDDYRRGQLSCHKKFGEGVAILAGNALLTHAFALMTSHSIDISYEAKMKIIKEISSSIGIHGMLAGQAFDIKADALSYSELEILYHLKTGALIIASCTCGALLGNASDDILEKLRYYSAKFGLIFQLIDDIADYDNDKKSKSKNILKVLRKEDAIKKIDEHLIDALNHIEDLQYDTSFLISFIKNIARQ